VPYAAEISRANPSCFLFLIDQSGSMEDPWAGQPGKKKAEALADIMNRMLQNLTLRCAKSEGVRDYYHVGVIGYGATVGAALGGSLAGRAIVPISTLADNPARLEERVKKEDDGAGGVLERKIKFPVWVDPVARGGTPMCGAFADAVKLLSAWVAEHPQSFPPIVINITDGESTDGNPTAQAEALRAIHTEDGNLLLFNAHLSASDAATPILYPDTEENLPDHYARLLFRLCSPMPEYLQSFARQEGFALGGESRGYVFNADPVSIIQFLDIGTRPSNLR